MKLFVFVCILLLWPSVLVADDSECVKTFKTCSKNEDCCTGCCTNERCVPYLAGCNKDINPCNTIICSPNTYCYLQKVQCIQAPCPPIPICKPIDPDYE